MTKLQQEITTYCNYWVAQYFGPTGLDEMDAYKKAEELHKKYPEVSEEAISERISLTWKLKLTALPDLPDIGD